MKLSGQNTKELMARLIRKEFDSQKYEVWNYNFFMNLIGVAKSLELNELANEMISDLKFEINK